MIRVYLDWSIMSNMRKKDNEIFKEIHNLIINNRDKILIPYTLAHVGDLVSNNDSETAKRETEKDLEYINHLTQKCAILYNPSTKRNSPAIQDVKKVYETLLYFYQEIPKDFESFFSDIEDSEFKAEFDKMIHLLKSFPSEDTGKSYSIIRPLESDTLLDEINTFVGIPHNYLLDTKYYHSLRTHTLKELKWNQDYTNKEKPIEKISNNLKKSAVDKTLSEFLKNVPSIIPTFINHYISIDYFGFYRDKKFKNLLLDALHAFYGAFCDYFVIEDRKAYNKTKAIYKYFNIDTKVCKSRDFNAEINKELNHLQGGNNNSLISNIISTIDSSFLLQETTDNYDNNVEIFEPLYPILYYFNRVKRTHQTNKTTVYLYKTTDNYSISLFFKEIKSIVNLVSSELGQDINNKYLYNEEIENQEIQEMKWQGRYWTFNYFTMRLRLDYENFPFSIILEILIPNNNDNLDINSEQNPH